MQFFFGLPHFILVQNNIIKIPEFIQGKQQFWLTFCVLQIFSLSPSFLLFSIVYLIFLYIFFHYSLSLQAINVVETKNNIIITITLEWLIYKYEQNNNITYYINIKKKIRANWNHTNMVYVILYIIKIFFIQLVYMMMMIM